MAYGDPYSYQGSRRIVSGRVLLALAIVAFSVVMYFSRTEVNPVTGKRQHIAMSVDQELAMGLEAAPEMAGQMGGAADPRRDPAAAFIAGLGCKLVAQSDAARSPYRNNFHFYLLNDRKTINAFALPGGQVFMTRGLFSRLSDEAEVAGVLGHEIGHVIGRHAAVQMAKGELGQRIAMAVGVGASGDSRHGRDAAMAAMMANQMLKLHFSRGDESEADDFGLKFMAEAGYDPRAMLDVMKVLKQASASGHTPEILQTHPLPDTRITRIEDAIKRDYPDGVPPSLRRGRDLGGGGAPRADSFIPGR